MRPYAGRPTRQVWSQCAQRMSVGCRVTREPQTEPVRDRRKVVADALHLTPRRCLNFHCRNCYSLGVHRSTIWWALRCAFRPGQGEPTIQQWVLGGALITMGLLQAAPYSQIRQHENSQALVAPPWFRRLTEFSNRSRRFFVLTRCVPLCVAGALWIVWPFNG